MKSPEVKSQPLVYEDLYWRAFHWSLPTLRSTCCIQTCCGGGQAERKKQWSEYITFALLGTKSHYLFCRSFSQSKQSRIPFVSTLNLTCPSLSFPYFFNPVFFFPYSILPSRYHLIPKNGQVTSFLSYITEKKFSPQMNRRVLQENI